MKKQYIIPIIAPNLGCLNECIFCNQKIMPKRQTQVTKEDVERTVEEYLANFDDENAQIEIAFFGGSFTALDVAKQEELLSAAYQFVKQKKVDGIRISTKPNCIDRKILKRLKKYKVKTIELTAQSSNDYLLKRSGRGYTFQDIKKASRLIRWYGFTLGHQIMCGLPDSTRVDEMKTAEDFAKLKPKFVRIHLLFVLKDTKLEEEYKKGIYEPLTCRQAVEVCKELYYFFDFKKIPIAQMGMPTIATICNPEEEGSQLVAGPYDEALEQRVEDAVWYEKMVDKIKMFNMKVREIEVRVNPANINHVIRT